jgi:hypothetical protein
VPETELPEWKWTQVPSFTHPEHEEWDLVQWEIENTLVLDPRAISNPVFEAEGPWWYMKTKEAPGLHHLPSLIVLFQIVSEPSDDGPGIIEGWVVWTDEDLRGSDPGEPRR